MTVESIAHSDFHNLIREALNKASGRLIVNIRLDGELTGSNVVVSSGNGHRDLRVSPLGGSVRSNTWNLVGAVGRLTLWPAFGPVQGTCEQIINAKTPNGWLRLVIQNNITTAAYRVTDPRAIEA